MRNNPHPQPRCPKCLMTQPLCICGVAPHLALRTRVAVIMHVRESVRPSNTGRLVPLALANSFVCLRGLKDQPTDTKGMIPPGTQGLVLYPSLDSRELNQDYLSHMNKPVTLVVLDGNWNQAAKMAKREHALDGLPRVHLAAGPASNFRLRTQSDPARVCTFEAVARALGAIEGAEVQQKLEAFFTVMVERMLWARGKLKAHQVSGG
ncbi:MAG TPA: tRNA-uridine aminocarboxypropyltransferase, partial [Candidatus Edwardsbacteria bacterium]|nr:tRNA-uridine aminocarboxypropyltransferase [Candidatus Edwardsbacteria bacterium]